MHPGRISSNAATVTVTMAPVRMLRVDPRNARTHSKKQTRLIASSIREFGFLSPIVIDDQGTILAGHGRVEAAKLEGLSQVPVIRVDTLTPEQKRAFSLADNKIAEHAGWDRERLALELGELSDLLPNVGLDISVTGFEAAEIDLLLADMDASQAPAPDVIPSLPETSVTQLGDQWALGKHRLLCGDARDPGNFKKVMRRDLASACFCDPPYNLRVSSIVGRGRHKHPEFAFASGEMSTSKFRQFLNTTLSNGAAVSRGGSIHFVCIDWRHYGDLREVSEEVYDEMLNLIVWVKTNAGQGSFYRSQHELIGAFRVNGDKHRNNIELGKFGRNRSNVWTYAGANAFGTSRTEALAAHPTVKPLALVADALLDCTARGDIVLDQFSGSGTTILAAEKVGRIARAIEYEPRYVDVAIMRWQQQTKLEAVLENDGRTFDEIRQYRARNGIDPHPHPNPGKQSKRTQSTSNKQRSPSR
jgi:DNA modification methylase